jgi:hypothetical protein
LMVCACAPRLTSIAATAATTQRAMRAMVGLLFPLNYTLSPYFPVVQ